MKAGANGVLNVSILDGWWDEGRRSDSGWTIASDVTLDHPHADDEAEAEALYRLLEERVVPLFYDRDPDGLPLGLAGDDAGQHPPRRQPLLGPADGSRLPDGVLLAGGAAGAGAGRPGPLRGRGLGFRIDGLDGAT